MKITENMEGLIVMMQTILNNLPLICLLTGLLICLICAIYSFLNMPRQKQLDALKEWLKWAVTEAEKQLKGGTGQLKLHMVYDLAIKQFPWMEKMISFDVFAAYVDDALLWMKNQILNNENVKSYVEGECSNGLYSSTSK